MNSLEKAKDIGKIIDNKKMNYVDFCEGRITYTFSK